jgi:hypothetical protein
MTQNERGFKGLKSSVSELPLENGHKEEVGETTSEEKGSGNPSESTPIDHIPLKDTDTESLDSKADSSLWSRMTPTGRVIVVVVGISLAWVVLSPNQTSTSRVTGSPSSTNQSTVSKIAPSAPLAGRDRLLTESEILYCLAEQTRIDAHRDVLNAYDSVAIDVFNYHVQDFNSRCSAFRYKQRQFDRAKKEHDANRNFYILQGRAR